MKYFIDTEFIEGFHKPMFGKRRHFIDLISIGIVAEDDRAYYAVSNEFNSKDANDWVYDNVIMNLMITWAQSFNGCMRNDHLRSIEGTGKHGSVRKMQKSIGKSNAQITKEIIEFVKTPKDTKVTYGNINEEHIVYRDFFPADEYINLTQEGSELVGMVKPNRVTTKLNTEFYGYYSDYDWVLFCSMFGTMMDLPKGFPMYCIDLMQTLDETANSLTSMELSRLSYPSTTHNVYATLDTGVINDRVKCLQDAVNYPKQTNEHNALADAKWNKDLFLFLKGI